MVERKTEANRGAKPVSVRRPSNRGGIRKNIGKTPSLKAGRPVWWESLLERDLVHLLEIDPDVVTYSEQPFRVLYSFEGKIRRYTPDFLVERKNKWQVVEVKSKEKASSEAFRLFRLSTEPEILKHARKFMADDDKRVCEFVVATEDKIRVQPRLENVKILRGYARTPFLPGQAVLCRKFLRENEGASIADLVATLSDKGVTLPVVYSLIYHGTLAIDFNSPLDPRSVVRSAAHADRLPTACGREGRQ
ncbi:MAG TPA: TnsA endonuclease N-terminal domain-containing protein [Pyrinomonadaceae bacterium]|jgi:hypothetical protein|nr:TnsA endonuclease N-terminal domain-containing protein [Pyrinomonadaceae bacterium]